MSDWGISSITAFEIFKGAKRQSASAVASDALKFLSLSTIHDFDFAAAESAAEVHQQLRILGSPIGLADEQIAGHAISLNVTLVSNNLKHFSQVPKLKLENWI